MTNKRLCPIIGTAPTGLPSRSCAPEPGIRITAGKRRPDTGTVNVPTSLTPALLFSKVTPFSKYGYGFFGSCGRGGVELPDSCWKGGRIRLIIELAGSAANARMSKIDVGVEIIALIDTPIWVEVPNVPWRSTVNVSRTAGSSKLRLTSTFRAVLTTPLGARYKSQDASFDSNDLWRFYDDG